MLSYIITIFWGVLAIVLIIFGSTELNPAHHTYVIGVLVILNIWTAAMVLENK